MNYHRNQTDPRARMIFAVLMMCWLVGGLVIGSGLHPAIPHETTFIVGLAIAVVPFGAVSIGYGAWVAITEFSRGWREYHD